MLLNELVGQLTLIGISGYSLTGDEKKFIVENNISGVVLFSRNVAEPKQIYDLCQEIQSLRTRMADKAPLFIGIDMEVGVKCIVRCSTRNVHVQVLLGVHPRLRLVLCSDIDNRATVS